MGKKTRINLIIRTLLLMLCFGLYIIEPSILKNILTFSVIGPLKIYHVFWAYLMLEMIVVLIPSLSQYTYSGKHFKHHYKQAPTINQPALTKFTNKNKKRAISALVFWGALNGIIGIIYLTFKLPVTFIYALFLFYYWSDMVCVNIWCPFHKIIVKNKCCNECRIYNWGHFMYLTPFIFIPNIWTYSLLLVSILIIIQWEYQNYKYPERFSPISNLNLRCSNCQNDCRFNTNKGRVVVNKGIQSVN